MVGTTGFEPATSSVSRKRSNQLSYASILRQRIVYQERGGGDRCLLCSKLRFWFRKDCGSRRSLGNLRRISKKTVHICNSPIPHIERRHAEDGECPDEQEPRPKLPVMDEGAVVQFAMAWRSSSCVFITIGPYHATGSSSGLPETSRKRMPSGPAWTTISSPRSKSTSEWFFAS